MANQEHLERLLRSIDEWNRWRKDYPDIQPDLSEAHLGSASLRLAHLHHANLRHANLNSADLAATTLTKADLSEADLSYADLSYADLSYADLSRVNLSDTDLSFADLSHAFLDYADLSGASLSQADFHHTKLSRTIFANNDFITCKGVVAINHRGPSRIELHTVRLPQDGSSLVFLRGAGIPDEWIDFYRAQMMSPIQYYSCFISYSSKDHDLAARLHNDLQAVGVRCWFAPHDLKIGDRYRSRINEAIHLQEKLLLILSQAAIESDWVEAEVETALEKERRYKRDILFPIRLDDSFLRTQEAWTAHIRQTRHIGDFTLWKDLNSYQQAFKRLLRDLKAL